MVENGKQENSLLEEKTKEDVVCLKPKMGLMNGITVIVGSIIGSGIFVSPKGVLENTGSVGLSLIVWVACGVFSMIGAYCYAELGCMITKSGADYTYIMESFGPLVAFLRLWVECIIVRPGSQAIVALTFSFYVMRPMYPDCDPPFEAVTLLAVLCICILTFVNCWDVKWATLVQDLFTYAKLLALAVIIITGIVQLAYGKVQNFTFENTETDVTKIALSFYAGLFAYNGWNYLNFVIEELKDPQRNLPIAIFVSCILVMVVYILTIVAFHTTLTAKEIIEAEAVAVRFAEHLYGVMAWVVPVFVALSTFGGVNGILFTTARLFYAGAGQGQMPQLLAMIQVSHLTPAPAVLFTSFLSMCYLCSDNIYALMNYVGFATWLAIGLGVSSLPYFRWKQPDRIRPIKVNLFFPIVYILATISITVLPMYAAPKDTGFGALLIASGVPVYFLFIQWKNKPKCIESFIGAVTKLLQKLLVVVPAEKPVNV